MFGALTKCLHPLKSEAKKEGEDRAVCRDDRAFEKDER